MKKIKIAFQNMLLHKMSSIVLIVVFAVSAFVMFWAFGYSNHTIKLVNKINRISYGDSAFLTEYFPKNALKELENIEGVTDVVFEREVNVMFDGEEKSSLNTLLELTPENKKRLSTFIKPVEGKLPEKPDEIVITDFVQKGIYNLGDYIHATTTTHDKILNTIRYKVVGVSKSTAFKAIGYGFMVTEDGMSSLINSNSHANLVYLYIDGKLKNDEFIKKVHLEAKNVMEKHKIKIKNDWTISEREAQLSVFALTFEGMKVLMLILIFPLLGAVIAAIVWIYSHKRRKEIWTYISLGMKDRDVLISFGLEYWFISVAGLLIGLSLGEFTAYLAMKTNTWLVFSYTFSTPVLTSFTITDFLIVTIFTFTSVFLWILFPINKIMKAVPFSY